MSRKNKKQIEAEKVIAEKLAAIEEINMLIKSGGDLNQKGDYGFTMLMTHSRNGHKEAVQLLINNGANLECCNDSGRTALMIATLNSNPEIVKLLIESGANVNAQTFSKEDEYGEISALMCICYDTSYWLRINGKEDLSVNFEIIKMLIDAGADINLKSDTGITALAFLIPEELVDMVKYLIKAGAKIEI